tara:strand:- start:2906 stop:3772 length:867 start_codon:yes stop_codon:yes gene_type:complete
MAVKPITNKQVVASSKINRGKQTSTKNINDNSSNRKQSFAPGINLSNNYAITLKDIDTAVMGHVKNVIRPKVMEADETIDVTVMYGNEERWKSVRKRGVMRDVNGSIILPLIMLKRTSIEKNQDLPRAEWDVKREHAQVVRKQLWSKKNRYDRFNVQFGNKPLQESLVTTTPNFVNINYNFIIWTNFIEQMNPLVEVFEENNNTYWGDSSDYKFLSYTDSITDASEMNQDGERFIKSEFTLITKAYLLPEDTNSVVTNKISNMQKVLSPSKVVFGTETDASDYQINKK